MEGEKPCLSCVDCHVYNCWLQDSRYPEFCLTTNVSEETKKRAMDALWRWPPPRWNTRDMAGAPGWKR